MKFIRSVEDIATEAAEWQILGNPFKPIEPDPSYAPLLQAQAERRARRALNARRERKGAPRLKEITEREARKQEKYHREAERQRRNAEIAKRLHNGESPASLASEYGLEARMISKIVPLQNRRWIHDLVRELDGRGFSDTKIARHAGVSVSTIGTIRDVMGLPRSTKKGGAVDHIRHQEAA